MREFAEQLLEFSSTNWGPLVLVAHAFLESFILPVTHELFLIPVALARPHLSLVFALMSTTASTLGISVGYSIGHWGGRPLILRFLKARTFLLVKEEIHKYDAWAVALACFTPVPVKVFALVAGAVGLNFRKMIIIAFFSRGLRYFLVSLLLYFYGEAVKHWILEYMDWFMIAAFLLVVVPFFIWKKLERHLLRKEYIELKD